MVTWIKICPLTTPIWASLIFPLSPFINLKKWMNKIMDCLNPTTYYGWLIENIHFLVLVLLHRLLRPSPPKSFISNLISSNCKPNCQPCNAFSAGWVSSTNNRLSWHTIYEDSMSIIIFMKMQKTKMHLHIQTIVLAHTNICAHVFFFLLLSMLLKSCLCIFHDFSFGKKMQTQIALLWKQWLRIWLQDYIKDHDGEILVNYWSFTIVWV